MDWADQLNVDGYPTEDGLKALRHFEGTPSELVDVLEKTFGRMGSVRAEDSTNYLGIPCKKVRLATGGWSGNENMIGALRHSYFWFCWWESSHRGGAFEFHVKKDAWDKPMPPWPPRTEN